MITAILLLSALCVIGCGKEAGRYYNKENKFSIKFPTGWQIKESSGTDQENEVLAASSPDSAAAASIRVQKFTMVMDLSLFAKELSPKLGAAKQLDGGIGKIDGRTAFWMVCEGNGAGPEFSTFYYCTTKEDRLYALIFVTKTDSFSRRRPEFEEIATSFKFE